MNRQNAPQTMFPVSDCDILRSAIYPVGHTDGAFAVEHTLPAQRWQQRAALITMQVFGGLHNSPFVLSTYLSAGTCHSR